MPSIFTQVLEWFRILDDAAPAVETVTLPPEPTPRIIVVKPIINITTPMKKKEPISAKPQPFVCMECKASVQPEHVAAHQEWHEASKQTITVTQVPIVYHPCKINSLKDYLDSLVPSSKYIS